MAYIQFKDTLNKLKNFYFVDTDWFAFVIMLCVWCNSWLGGIWFKQQLVKRFGSDNCKRLLIKYFYKPIADLMTKGVSLYYGL